MVELDVAIALDEEIARLKARITELEAVLEIFAEDENWRLGHRLDPNGSRFDGTEIARAALAKEPSDG